MCKNHDEILTDEEIIKTVYEDYLEYLEILEQNVYLELIEFSGNIDEKTMNFIRKAMEKHGTKYAYFCSKYKSCDDDIQVWCKEHKTFFKHRSSRHSSGQTGCKQCIHYNSLKYKDGNSPHKPKKQHYEYISTEEFITKAKEIHGDIYNYKDAECKTTRDVVTIFCNKHQCNFYITPHYHLKGQGCQHCAIETLKPIAYRKSHEEFIEEVAKANNYKYNYDKTVYVDSYYHIMVECPAHGLFSVSPGNHLHNLSGCPKCKNENTYKSTVLSKEQLMERFKNAHPTDFDNYSYDKVNYINQSTPIEIYCKKHEKYFLQTPSTHIRGCGCSDCGTEKLIEINTGRKMDENPNKKTLEEFIQQAQEIHGDEYDYSESVYVNYHTRLIINCQKHGAFSMTPARHLSGKKKCPICASAGTTSVPGNAWLDSLNIPTLLREHRLPEFARRPVDGYDPLTNTIYQFHGRFTHGDLRVFNPNTTHPLRKITYREVNVRSNRIDQDFRDAGYNLVIMHEYDWNLIKREEKRIERERVQKEKQALKEAEQKIKDQKKQEREAKKQQKILDAIKKRKGSY